MSVILILPIDLKQKTPNYKAKYVKGIKIFMALIKSTANNMKTTIEKIIAFMVDVAELT